METSLRQDIQRMPIFLHRHWWTGSNKMSHPHIRAKDDSSLLSTCTSESRFLLPPLSIPAVRAILRRPRRLLGWLLLRGLHTPPLLLLWGLLRDLLAPPLLLLRLLWRLRRLLTPLLGLTPLLLLWLLWLSLPAILHEWLLLRHRCQGGCFGGM